MFNFYQKPFGLDISDNSVKIVLLEGSIERPRLLSMAKTDLKLGVVKSGEIIKAKELEAVLDKLISNPQFGAIKTRNLIFSLPEMRIFTHLFKMEKNLKKNEEMQRIKSEASQSFPYPFEDLYLDYLHQNENEVLLVAVQKPIINDYLVVFKNCRIKPLIFETESESLVRSLAGQDQSQFLLIDIGADITYFYAFDKRELKLNVSLPVAGSSFTKKVSEKFNLSLKEAEMMKKEIGLNPEKEEGRVFLILQEKLQQIITKIREIDDYFCDLTGETIKKIILSGGSALISQLPSYLSENLEKEVLIGDPWQKVNIDFLKKKEYFEEAREIDPIIYSKALGSALRGLSGDYKKTGINLIKDIK
jgi:type IV pilus assembly protein PilM